MTHFLAGIAQLPDETVSSSFSNSNGMPLAVMLRGLGLTIEAVTAISKVRGHHLNLSEKDNAAFVESYAKIGARDAEKSLQMLREKANAESGEPGAKPAAARSVRSR